METLGKGKTRGEDRGVRRGGRDNFRHLGVTLKAREDWRQGALMEGRRGRETVCRKDGKTRFLSKGKSEAGDR